MQPFVAADAGQRVLHRGGEVDTLRATVTDAASAIEAFAATDVRAVRSVDELESIYAEARGIEVRVDSAGTGSWHVGDPPDHRMQAAAAADSLGGPSADETGATDQQDPAETDGERALSDRMHEIMQGLGLQSELQPVEGQRVNGESISLSGIVAGDMDHFVVIFRRYRNL